jgi:hypothetical protein
MKILRCLITFITIAIAFIYSLEPAWAFCGFYVAKADSNLYNKASQVIIARDGDRTILTMANDYQGDVKDFALVVPVPTVLTQDRVHVGNPTIIERLDAFSAPRLVEYFDSDPCQPMYRDRSAPTLNAAPLSEEAESINRGNNALGVTVEEQFTVGEYDIVILSAKESNGLETWLNQNGYKIPRGANQLLRPYIKQKMKFFVAKVNLKEFDKTGFQSLRPLMMAYESTKFMLPIRLGMVNAKNEQDLIVYLLSPKGQTELTNYRTVNIPSDANVPEYVQQEFGSFYKAMFANTHEKENKKVAFLEYAWDMNNCDPCSAEPLSSEELKQAGVFWLDANTTPNVFISRLHVRYTRDKFPEDLQFHETANQQSFQGRYIINHPFKNAGCDGAKSYYQSVRERQEQEAQNLARLTGWNINNIRQKIDFVKLDDVSWWQKFWSFLLK